GHADAHTTRRADSSVTGRRNLHAPSSPGAGGAADRRCCGPPRGARRRHPLHAGSLAHSLPMTRAPDKSILDSQFTLDTIVDVDVLMARREAAARAALESFECIRGIRYGKMTDETLNIFPPRRHDASAPVQIFIHGGF